MIVKCEQCQTRFKIPDDKVTEKGVKVRCTKCQHTFRVMRDKPVGESPSAVAPPPVVPPAEPEDPFARFGSTANDASLGEATRPGMYALGVEASRKGTIPLQPSFAAQMDQPSTVFERPTRILSLPAAPPGRRPLTDAAPAPSAPPPLRSDPLPSPSAPPPLRRPSGDGPPPSAPSSRRPLPDRAALPPAAIAEPEPQPFDFSAVLSAPPEPVPAAPAAPEPFDFGPPPEASAPAPEPKYAGLELDGLPSNPQDFSAYDPFTGGPPVDAARNPMPPATEAAPVPSVFGSDGGDFFSDEPPASEPPPTTAAPSMGEGAGREVEADTGLRSQLFDMPAPDAAPAPVAVSAVASLFEEAPAVVAPPPAASPVSPIPELPARKLSGWVLNVAVAGTLVLLMTVISTVYLNEGKVELASFSFDRLKATFFSDSRWVTLDVSNGLYDTRAGRPVFFVRGEVKNRSKNPIKARVRAEILDGNTSIRQADVWIGVTPTPEDLFSITVAEDVDHLIQKLGAAAAPVNPGEKRGFLVPFYEYPSDLKGFRVKVTVLELARGETAAR